MIKFWCFKDEGGRNGGDHGFDLDMEFDDLRKWIDSHWRLADHRSSNESALQCDSWKWKGRFYGKVAKIFTENGHQVTDRCWSCKGKLRGKRILGMTILADFVAANSSEYTNGRILDPTSGEIYHCRMTLIDGGRQLNVRGYIGLPLIGRSDVWRRLHP